MPMTKNNFKRTRGSNLNKNKAQIIISCKIKCYEDVRPGIKEIMFLKMSKLLWKQNKNN